MKLENQVCNLEQAKKLNDLKVIQQSEFAHFAVEETGLRYLKDSKNFVGVKANRERYYHSTNKREEEIVKEHIYSAFTVAELGVMCRDCISGHCANTGTERLPKNHYYATPDEYHGYDLESVEHLINPDRNSFDPWYCQRDTQAQALADLLIFLIANNLIKVEEVNQRLTED